MPNPQNITAPVTLLGVGRSGTTLVSAAFEKHPEFHSAGESGGMIFSVWEGAKSTYMPLPRAHWDLASDLDARSAYYVQAAMMALCPSSKRRWFQKPAGFPIWHLNTGALPGKRTEVTGFPVEWYWDVLRKSFPDAKFLTVLRNPFDVALSRREHTNWDLTDVLMSSVQFCEVLEYRRDAFCSIVSFTDLIGDFEGTLRTIADAAAFKFDTRMLSAIKENQAPVKGRAPKPDHMDSWSAFEGLEIRRDHLQVMQRTWNDLGMELKVPAGLIVS